MEEKRKLRKELFFYLVILILLIMIIICNNVFWKFGQQTNSYNVENNITNFNSDNIIYNVLFEEEWLE